MNLSVSITSRNLEADIHAVASALAGAGRAQLNQAMGESVRDTVRDHLRALAQSRHTTAEKLGATPTGHLEQAARAIEGSPVSATSSEATLTINHVGMIRALKDVTILPKKQFLTIPMNAIAYGRRIGECDQVQIVHRGEAVRTDIAAYILVRSVTQKQDRSLLPSDAELQDAAVLGAKQEVKRINQKISA